MNDYNFEKIEPFDFEEYYEYNYQLEIKNEEFKEFFFDFIMLLEWKTENIYYEIIINQNYNTQKNKEELLNIYEQLIQNKKNYLNTYLDKKILIKIVATLNLLMRNSSNTYKVIDNLLYFKSLETNYYDYQKLNLLLLNKHINDKLDFKKNIKKSIINTTYLHKLFIDYNFYDHENILKKFNKTLKINLLSILKIRNDIFFTKTCLIVIDFLISKNKSKTIIKILSKLIYNHQNNFTFIYLLAYLYEKINDLENAISYYKLSYNKCYDKPRVLNLIISYYIENQKIDKLLPFQKEIVKIEIIDRYNNLKLLGNSYLKIKNYSEALKYYEALNEKYINFFDKEEIYKNMILCCVQIIEKLEKMKPNNNIKLKKLNLYYSKYELLLLKSIEIDPTYPFKYLELSSLYQKLGDYFNYVLYFNQAIRLMGNGNPFSRTF